jgi:autoinducer 2 (AI-2) kinase
VSAYAIGLDLGGGGVRCLLLDLHSGATTCASEPLAPVPRVGSSGLGFDLPLATATDALARVIRRGLEQAEAHASDVIGVACTSMRHSTVVVDTAGEPILSAPNCDARAAETGLRLAKQHGEALQQRTGHWPMSIFAAARLRWLVETQPQDIARAAHFLSLSDWMGFRLSGVPASEPSQAAASLLYDITADGWAWDWVDRLEIPRRLLPELRVAGSPLGAVTADAAARFGLRAGTPVFVGGADTQCGLLGAGVLEPGAVGVIAGSTAPVQAVLDRPTIDAQARVWTGRHVLPQRWVLESNAGPVGDALDWIARILYPNPPAEIREIRMLLGEAAASEPGARGLLSSLGAQLMDAKHSRLPVGHLSLSPMTTANDSEPRRHLARAIVEGALCGLRSNVEQAREVAGIETTAGLTLAGGLSRSPLFAQLLADLMAEPVTVGDSQSTALGAALCVATGVGRFDGLGAASLAQRARAAVISPDPATAEANLSLYQRWTQLRLERSAADVAAARLATPFALSANRALQLPEACPFRPRILVTADCDPDSLSRLGRLGEVEYASYRDKKRMLKGPSLIEALQGVSIFVTEIDLVDAQALAALPELRAIVSCRGDAVNIDVAACTAFGIPMLRTPGRNADAVADLTLAFLLMLARRLPEATGFLRQPGIEPGDMGTLGRAFVTLRGRELWKKTVGLIGLGAVGSKVAERLRPFGARILVADPYVDPVRAAAAGVESVELEVLLRESDFVSLHAAVTPETSGMFGANQFAALKPGACLINTARAALLDEAALLTALQDGRLAGAALDTFAVEPPGSQHPLLAHPGVIATPHIGGNTREVAAHQGKIVVEELSRLMAGEAPRHALNPEVLAYFSWTRPRPEPPAGELERLKRAPAPAVSDLQKQQPTPAKRL